MHSRFRTRGALTAALIALAIAVLLPSVANALPKPGAKPRGFRLFARSGSVLGALTGNRVYCGLATDGRVCVDSTNSSTIGGGFWPKGTPDQYVFNSGLQLAGIIGTDGGAWAGDTVGAFFFDPKGTTEHGEPVNANVGANNVIQGLYNSSRADDLAEWPDAACVPNGDNTANFFDQALQTDPGNVANPSCRKFASQQDVWFLSWEGNPALNAGRKHPLGVMVETRGMTWNFPVGNEDILYFIYTFYNITSTNAADYAAIRPSIQPVLMERAQKFHDLVQQRFGVAVPAGGYTINNLFAAFSADMDVAEAGTNYSSVNLPFALGYVYAHDFLGAQGWQFDPSIFKAPFFAGAGFVGVKYLASPTGAGVINLFSNTINQGAFDDAQNTIQLYRYLSGNISNAAGDASCTYSPSVDHICFVNTSGPDDMRFFQSSSPLTLSPGGYGSIVVAYVFAAPVGPQPNCAGSSNCVVPGNPTFLSNPTRMANGTGASLVDTISGFRDWTDVNGDGIVEQSEFTVVNGSLLQKSIFAQTLFDGKFLLPAAPASPEFFLIPGDNAVTVMWQPSSTETGAGDPFFQVASTPLRNGLPNPFYDPSYIQNDVEGYRVYRGRVDAPNELTLLTQFDYSGTTINDYTGTINTDIDCAPEFALTTSCPGLVANLKDGTDIVATVTPNPIPLAGNVVQVRPGSGRFLLSNGTALIALSDTAVTGGALNGPCGPKSRCPSLDDTGVPFVYVDNTPRNNFRYFYSVTAFDVNSFQSGNSSLESARSTKAVTPVKAAGNSTSSAQVTASTLEGRGVALDTSAANPTLDATTGRFSGPFPPANNWFAGLGALVSQVLNGAGSYVAHLDSIQLGSPYQGVKHTYWFTAAASGSSSVFSISIDQQQEFGVETASAAFSALPIDNGLAGRYGGNSSYKLPGQVDISSTGVEYEVLYGRGCINVRPGFGDGTACSYNGSRWFDGPSPTTNETQADPQACDVANFSGTPMTCYNNAGALTGVTTINQNKCYQSAGGSTCRQSTGIMAGAHRAADFNVYWGAGGKIDSVIDVTHNVPVPGPADPGGWNTHVGGTWGILNQAATAVGPSPDGSTTLTNMDFACVEPFRSYAAPNFLCPAGTPAYTLSDIATPGPLGFFSGGDFPPAVPIDPAGSNGFVLYVAGDIFTVEPAGGAVPASGTIWSLRQYVGAITGGNGAGGPMGPYAFSQPDGVRPLTAVGTDLRVAFQSNNQIASATVTDLKKVHTVPDPYYVTSEFEQTTDTKFIKFVNLPAKAIIRIYSSSGVLVNVLENPGNSCQNFDNLFPGAADNPAGGECSWNVRNRNNQVVASGVYFYHIESGDARRVGRFTVVNFAQ
jgi:hypothetical protein